MELNNPDQNIRKVMLEEFNRDLGSNQIYFPRTTIFQNLFEEYKSELGFYIKSKTMGEFIELLNSKYINWNSTQKNGSKVPKDSDSKLGVGEWNKYFMKGICNMAIDSNKKIQIVRWKQVLNPKFKIGLSENTILEPNEFYSKINRYPFESNSGLTIKIIN